MHDIPQLFTGRARSCLPSDVTLSAADYPVDLSSATCVKLLKCLRAIQRGRLAASPRRLLVRRCRACDTWLGTYSDYMEEACLVSGHNTRNTNKQLSRCEMRRTRHVLTDGNTTGDGEHMYLWCWTRAAPEASRRRKLKGEEQPRHSVTTFSAERGVNLPATVPRGSEPASDRTCGGSRTTAMLCSPNDRAQLMVQVHDSRERFHHGCSGQRRVGLKRSSPQLLGFQKTVRTLATVQAPFRHSRGVRVGA
jgi:hypothetical protein